MVDILLPSFCNSEKWNKSTDAIFINKDVANVDTVFSEESQDNLFEIEDLSWWFHYRATIILSLMDKYFDTKSLTVDVGAGNGYTSSRAALKGYNVCTIEPSLTACKHANIRGINPVLCGVLDEESILDNSIDQILMLDCLEHIEDDEATLSLLFKKLKPGGVILITVPAFMSLWSSEDVMAGHFRRYTCTMIQREMTDAGFKVLHSSYFMSFLYAPILISRVLKERIGLIKKTTERTKEENSKVIQKQFISSNELINNFINWICHKEMTRLIRSKKIPLGSSVIIVAKKEKNDT